MLDGPRQFYSALDEEGAGVGVEEEEEEEGANSMASMMTMMRTTTTTIPIKHHRFLLKDLGMGEGIVIHE